MSYCAKFLAMMRDKTHLLSNYSHHTVYFCRIQLGAYCETEEKTYLVCAMRMKGPANLSV